MPRGGQNRKPRQSKIIQGTFRKDRNPSREPEPSIVPEPPKPPSGLNRWARREWKRLAAELAEQGLLTIVDLAALEIACVALVYTESARMRSVKPAVWRNTCPRQARIAIPGHCFRRCVTLGARTRHTLVSSASRQPVGIGLKPQTENTLVKTSWNGSGMSRELRVLVHHRKPESGGVKNHRFLECRSEAYVLRKNPPIAVKRQHMIHRQSAS
jgi:hypothetical protein